ncbi:MAG: hypothetical protein K2P84_02355 [Undibacterium sp.]|nr:hypothetical protein [Undibacterium sp.]
MGKMMRQSRLSVIVLGLIFGMLSSPFVSAKQTTQDMESITEIVQKLAVEFATGSIISSEIADLALLKTEQAQRNLQDSLKKHEAQCYDNFFVNSCLDDLRLKRRQLQDLLKRISIEAKSYLRKAKAMKVEEEKI